MGLGLFCLATGAAQAQTIGRAATVRNDVAKLQGPRVTVINVGDDVVRNEIVRTGAVSAAKLVFSDNTNLAIGPSSRVTLDTFVFAGDGSYKKAVVNLVKGAFRFTTGGSEKRAYKINTPVATIGVRGTILDILSSGGRTVVTLGEGKAIVCARGTARCETISNPGDTVVVTSGGVAPGRTPYTFADNCAGDDLCAPARFAAAPASAPITLGSAEPDNDWSGFYVGGFGGGAVGGRSSQRDNGIPVVTRPAGNGGTTTTTPANTAPGTTTPATTTPVVAPPRTTAPTTVTNPSADGSYGLGGGLGGGMTGYNFRLGRVVLGVEADVGGGSVGGSSGTCGTSAHRCGTSMSAATSVRGRLGLPYGNIMPFVTAGPAFQRISAYDALYGTSGAAWRTGYAVGGGIEYKFARLVTLRLEYLHAGFGSAHLFDIVPGVPEQISARTDVIRVGVTFSMSALNPRSGGTAF